MREPFAKFIETELGSGFLLIACGLPGTWKTETTEEVSRIKGYPLLRSDLIRLKVLKNEDIFDEKIASNMDKRTMVYDEMFRQANETLEKGDVAKYPLSLAEASKLVRNAGGMLVQAHPNDPNGTSLVNMTSDLEEQARIIEEYMLNYIDGIECWHPRHDVKTIAYYIEFAKKHGLGITGGSDCHQKPLRMGTLAIPDWVAAQFR